jgi:hypothetical protein
MRKKIMKDGDLLQTIITKNILDKINKRYYAFIPKTVDFEHIVKTPNFSNEVTKNVALYSDHGLNHVLNVATEIPVILRTISDVHLPKRSEKRSEFMIRYGTILVGKCMANLWLRKYFVRTLPQYSTPCGKKILAIYPGLYSTCKTREFSKNLLKRYFVKC